MGDYSYLSGTESQYIDQLYKDYREDPDQVEATWKKFFEGFEFALTQNGHGDVSEDKVEKEIKVIQLINAYRMRAHLTSDTNPIRPRKNRSPYLSLEDNGLEEADLKDSFYAGIEIGLPNVPLSEIIDKLKSIYCGVMGFEFMHIRRKEEREWFREKVEQNVGSYDFPLEKKKRILGKLNEAAVFEKFLHTKYIGQKRFSLEGGENTIPALDAIVNKSSSLGVNEIVLGMAHRGRLNVLANILGKTYDYIFSEFEGLNEPELAMGDGDVKYHLGFSSQIKTPEDNTVEFKLMPNPSHLEAVDPVVQGYARGKGDLLYDENHHKVLPVLIHGDAAMAGQGIVYEIAQMSQLDGYFSGGTLHFVINNQIGFTTNFDDARSSDYCTTIAREIDAPVIHVNGDDAEAVVYAVELAAEFRQKFQRDVFVDMLCYRKHGHNESDEPKFTQPALYNMIAKQPDPRQVYKDKLVKAGDIEAEIAQNMEKEFKKLLQDRLNMVKQKPPKYEYQPQDLEWKNLRNSKPEDFKESPDTSVTKKQLDTVFDSLKHVPEKMNPIRTFNRVLKDMEKKYNDGIYDWAMAELSAYGTLLLDKNNVRLSGQDSIRGTFSHRHAEVYDNETNERYNRLRSIETAEGKFRIYNSLLSENGALGFEYGYSLSNPHCLTIWEAQFGDFNNGAQVIIDQFISSGGSKWQKMNGVTLLLPHGYEGQGPEHSSARPERFLQLCAENNMVVANCTMPANFFHLLRRQVKWPFRKPLVVMTPKSLLRHPKCVSPIKDFTDNKFRELIDDEFAKKSKVKRVLLCSGKVYYDLLEKQQEDKREDVAIVRLEQLYPLPETQLWKIYDKYKKADFYWVQEEPMNMGAWTFLLRWSENHHLKFLGRKASASPATGYASVHNKEQKDIVNQAFE